jgi:hypothetical protein
VFFCYLCKMLKKKRNLSHKVFCFDFLFYQIIITIIIIAVCNLKYVTDFDVELHLMFRFIGELRERVARDVR